MELLVGVKLSTLAEPLVNAGLRDTPSIILAGNSIGPAPCNTSTKTYGLDLRNHLEYNVIGNVS